MGALTTEQKKSLPGKRMRRMKDPAATIVAPETPTKAENDTYTYAEIAEKVGSTRQTISKWAEAGKWDELKTYATAGKDRILKNIYLRIEQLTQKTLDWEKIVKEHNGNVPAALMIMAPGKGQADEIIKLSAAAKKLENGCSPGSR